MSKQVGCTPTYILLLSFHIFIALVHPLHGNPYSLTLISIDEHLHSLLVRLVDVRLSPSFCLLHNHHILFHHSAIYMTHAHVLRESWKSLRTWKVWNNCLACHWGCAWFKYFVWWRLSIARLYDFVGITFFGHVIWKDMITLLVWLKYYCLNVKW